MFTREDLRKKLLSMPSVTARMHYLTKMLRYKEKMPPKAAEAAISEAVSLAQKENKPTWAYTMFDRFGLHREGAKAFLAHDNPGYAASLYHRAGLHKEGARAILAEGVERKNRDYTRIAGTLLGWGGFHGAAGRVLIRASEPGMAREQFVQAGLYKAGASAFRKTGQKEWAADIMGTMKLHEEIGKLRPRTTRRFRQK